VRIDDVFVVYFVFYLNGYLCNDYYTAFFISGLVRYCTSKGALSIELFLGSCVR
jgi:hypothetical protein